MSRVARPQPPPKCRFTPLLFASYPATFKSQVCWRDSDLTLPKAVQTLVIIEASSSSLESSFVIRLWHRHKERPRRLSTSAVCEHVCHPGGLDPVLRRFLVWPLCMLAQIEIEIDAAPERRVYFFHACVVLYTLHLLVNRIALTRFRANHTEGATSLPKHYPCDACMARTGRRYFVSAFQGRSCSSLLCPLIARILITK